MQVIDTTPHKMNHSDFRKFLQDELISRCKKNKGYSLRAFARQMGVNHATLSCLLAGKRTLTKAAIVKLSKALNLSSKQIDQFLHFHESTSQNSVMTEHQILTIETFTAISEWHYAAILELTHVTNFQPEIKWISASLGITIAEARDAVDRLVRLELLEINGDKWIDTSRNITTNLTNNFTSAALRQLQSKILKLSHDALENLPRTQRDHTSLTVAMQTRDLDEVKERIKKFRFELVNFIERKKTKPDAVYQFAFSVFPLTKN